MTGKSVINGPGDASALAVAGHLRWVHSLLAGPDLPAERRDVLRSRLWSVQARVADPELRVAVFGETSSGKSTLLNAFLRRRMLPSSARVTTRTTTVLRYRDGAEGLMVRTADDAVLRWPSEPFARWTGHSYGPGAAALEGALERVLTTDLAEQVRGLQILSPVRLLGGGVTVVDTPGFSVTDRGHRELAVAAARQADLALVVMPAVAAMSLTLVDFLTGPLRDHHDRCAFVLTKLDLLEEDDRPEAVEVVGHRLKELGIADAVLLPCAPGKALAEAVEAGGRVPDASGHLAPFLMVEARIARLAADRRRSAVAATVLGLLSELLSAVEETADRRRAELSSSGRELATLTLPDFTAFLEAWAERGLGRLRTEPHLGDPTRGLPAVRAKLEDKVAAAVAGDKINNLGEAAAEVSRLVRVRLGRYAERALRKAAHRAGELLASAADELARDFAAQYSSLAGLAGETRTAPTAPPVDLTELPAPDLSGIDQALTSIGARMETGGNWRTGGGAAAGAIAGSLIAPGIGTVLGGLLGAFIGVRGSDATRQQFLDQARPLIDAAQAEIGALVAAYASRAHEGVTDGIAALRRQYDDEWREEIARLTAANDRQRDRLAAGITAAEKAAAAARRRRERVAAMRRETTPRTAPEPEEP
ncbi:dynamin family protein [Streptomyces sp. NPDC005322]|uniref:dynamin family protein n=1 Tax=Streptomyces sp. NPDC005322 TaxID=3157032 RepID=UPI0033B07EA8